MPSSKNLSAVTALEEQLTHARAVVLADYRGLSVADLGKLRQAIKAAGGALTVTKNTLLKIALKANDQVLDQTLEDALQGPTALILALDDQIAPIKALVEFAKAHALELPQPKAGLLDDKVLTAQDIKTLAVLPSRDQLLAQLLRGLQGPSYGLVSVFSGNLRKLVYVLNAVKHQKGGDN